MAKAKSSTTTVKTPAIKPASADDVATLTDCVDTLETRVAAFEARLASLEDWRLKGVDLVSLTTPALQAAASPAHGHGDTSEAAVVETTAETEAQGA